MKPYPSIPNQNQISRSGHWFGFDKLDGSNIRAEWTRKTGFHKFGRRHGLLDHSNPVLLEAPDLIMKDFAEVLEEEFRKRKLIKATAFFEFYGEHSFAGTHEDEEHKVTLIDIAIHKQGFIPTQDFLKIARGLDTPNLVCEGPITAQLINKIKRQELKGVTDEGVVFKKNERNKRFMFKVKSIKWIERLKAYCGHDEEMFKKLL